MIMPMTPRDFNAICPKCREKLEYEGVFIGGDGIRFDRYRCKACGTPIDFRVDYLIEEIFPEIEELEILVTDAHGPWSRKFDKHSGSRLQFCHNGKCSSPGIFIEFIIREMIESEKTHLEKYEFCSGRESSPQGRRQKSCESSAKLIVDLKLKA
jgi:hypothetical protein